MGFHRHTDKDLQDRNIEPEKFEDRIIFMSMFNDIRWTKRGHAEKCISNSEQVKNYATTQMVERSKETGHSVLKSISALSRRS